MDVLIFFTFFDNFALFAEIRNLSRPPLKSTVLTAALATLSFMSFFLFLMIFIEFNPSLRCGNRPFGD